MNREEIFKKLKESGLDKDKIIIVSGASLVAQKIIEKTHDIDISCPREYYEIIPWKTKKGAYNVDIKYKDIFDISYNLYNPRETIIIDGYRFMNAKECLKVKKQLNRPKDQETIVILEDYIANNKQ